MKIAMLLKIVRQICLWNMSKINSLIKKAVYKIEVHNRY